jgi:hypothetical protein
MGAKWQTRPRLGECHVDPAPPKPKEFSGIPDGQVGQIEQVYL